MTSKEHRARQDWLFLEAIVGDSRIELREIDDGVPDLAAHEPSEAELSRLAAAVTPHELSEQRAAVDELIRAEWDRARTSRKDRSTQKRTALRSDMTRLELLAMIEQLSTAHPGQFAQHYRNLDVSVRARTPGASRARSRSSAARWRAADVSSGSPPSPTASAAS